MSRRRKARQEHEVSRGVIAILLLVFAIISFLSFFDKAGTLGVIINEWILSFFFGSIRYFVPFVVVILAWYLVTDKKYDYRPTHGIGAIMFFLTTSSLLHLRFDLADMWQQALDGHGGGVFGMLAWVLKNYLGSLASIVVLLGLILISLILMFNTSLAHFVTAHKRLMERLGFVGSGIKQGVDTLFVERDEQEDDEEEWEEDEEEEDEFEIEERRFSRKKMDDQEDEDEGDEEEEEYEEEEEDEQPRRHSIPLKEEMPFWQQHVIVRKPPSVSLLEVRKGKPTTGDLEENKRIIQDTFREFRIDVDMEDVRIGPSVTQFTMKPAKGVKLSRITSLGNDLALALAAHPIRIEAPIPGKSLVGIEVPNNTTAMVSLRELIESKPFKTRKHDMMIGLGKDVAGKVWFADLPRMPHLLIAGSTGSGKTVCMNTIITSLLFQNTAQDLRMIMVDPKRVELTLYNGIPHLLTPVITDTKKTINALRWTISEMERRFDLLSKSGNRDIQSYNKAHPKEKLPYIAFIIDELADLMVTASNDVETAIIRIAQMARAVGIHLIVATQRPSVDVITGLMKANIPGRIAFSVASITDSRTILDTSGAEKLIGKGDMLLMTSDFSKPVRIQGAYISEKETKDIIDYLRGDDEPVYDESITNKQGSAGGTQSMFGDQDDDQDALFDEAKHAILQSKKASASFLQRKLKVGYARAARILDELEEAGIVGPSNGSKPRDILITEKDLHTMDAGQSATVFKKPNPPKKKQEEIDEPEGEYEDDYEEDYDEEEEYDGQDMEDEEDAFVEEEHDEEEAEDEDDEHDEEENDYDEDETQEYMDDEDDEQYDDEEDDEDKKDFPIRNISP